MNIIDALKRSKETGERFRRGSGPGGLMMAIGFYDKNPYSPEGAPIKRLVLLVEDIIADDWEPAQQSHDLLPPSAAKSPDTEAMLAAKPTWTEVVEGTMKTFIARMFKEDVEARLNARKLQHSFHDNDGRCVWCGTSRSSANLPLFCHKAPVQQVQLSKEDAERIARGRDGKIITVDEPVLVGVDHGQVLIVSQRCGRCAYRFAGSVVVDDRNEWAKCPVCKITLITHAPIANFHSDGSTITKADVLSDVKPDIIIGETDKPPHVEAGADKCPVCGERLTGPCFCDTSYG